MRKLQAITPLRLSADTPVAEYPIGPQRFEDLAEKLREATQLLREAPGVWPEWAARTREALHECARCCDAFKAEAEERA